jgi:hypothetical protein
MALQGQRYVNNSTIVQHITTQQQNTTASYEHRTHPNPHVLDTLFAKDLSSIVAGVIHKDSQGVGLAACHQVLRNIHRKRIVSAGVVDDLVPVHQHLVRIVSMGQLSACQPCAYSCLPVNRTKVQEDYAIEVGGSE